MQEDPMFQTDPAFPYTEVDGRELIAHALFIVTGLLFLGVARILISVGVAGVGVAFFKLSVILIGLILFSVGVYWLVNTVVNAWLGHEEA